MPANTINDATQTASPSEAQLGPPATIEFAMGGKRPVRYNRMARSGDSDAAVLGKGGFGCVYRYAIDTSFTPPSSMDLSLSLRSATARRHASALGSSPSSHFQDGHSPSRTQGCEDVAATNSFLRPASLVAVKLCRTPCSGSFDELQKTSLVDKRTRRADLQDDSKAHVRIVRGEGRIFQYLQAALLASGRSDEPPLVKLLANLSPNGTSRDNEHDAMDISLDEEDGPPTRLLVFEKLIEIDAERTSQGWIKSNATWTQERVEKAALEVMQGLQFLHEHNVTHGDLKPSNLMLDPRTGVVKIIDLGASRRFVKLPNKERNNRSAVEEQDRQRLANGQPMTRLAPEFCEGLGSLTGSPYYMAPEILLQATRYIDVSGRARSVLEDYEYDFASFLPREQWSIYHIGLSDLRRGWGICADIWSWACTVQALLLKTVDEDQRPSSSTISPYDFSFSRHRDEMIDPLYEKSPGVDDVPRFHQWCRVLPLLIVRIALEPVPLTPQADGCSPALRSALKGSLRHQDLRPTADEVVQMLQASRPYSRASFAPVAHSSGRSYSATSNASPHPSTVDKARRHSQLGPAASDKSASPGLLGPELECSRYTTPPLSQGASSISSAQPTCEIAARTGCQGETADLNRKVRFDTSSADSSFYPAPLAESHLSSERDMGAGDAMPRGFELVSPARTERIRASTLRAATRPSTAGAALETSGSSLRDARSVHTELMAGAAISRPHPSTPTSAAGDRLPVRARTDPRKIGADSGRSRAGLPLSQGRSSVHKQRDGDSKEAVYDGLGICWPMESMRTLRLDEAGGSRQMPPGVSASVPSSPVSHVRGASMPLLASTSEQRSGAGAGSTRRAGVEDIGGSPRCIVGESKSSKSGSLMATLKEKQVRLKQSSKKLMGKRGSGARSINEDENSFSHRGGDRDVNAVYMSGREAVVDQGVDPYPMSSMMQSATSHLPLTPVVSMPLRATSPSTSYGHQGTGTMSRRSTHRTAGGEEESPSKPLLRRLLTWSTAS
ncbi:hypothetical protein EX895_005410 [Sporisorium graminicola]|uniref:Protein kinase domain-containing protein n=1 Tax=Sporisorium graminicola TaxID=280036 RepID=A0A4V6YEL8_9BASI|nr:hypothetical protein EX895_005410 [Sporisorium graminicola]TKY85869.1 hypothetical protein EX895_005410 [Sporisorium graminicola]